MWTKRNPKHDIVEYLVGYKGSYQRILYCEKGGLVWKWVDKSYHRQSGLQQLVSCRIVRLEKEKFENESLKTLDSCGSTKIGIVISVWDRGCIFEILI